MTMIVNPGSRIPVNAGTGWTNTYEGAVTHANEWLKRMRADHITDVELVLPGIEHEGRWRFGFRHLITGVVVYLETHGIDDYTAYEKERIFGPKTYWDGSSVAEPQVENWAAPGFTAVKTFVAAPTATEEGSG